MATRLSRPILVFVLCAAFAAADEAVESDGRKHRGRLTQDKDGWFFQADRGKRILLAQFSHVRFESKPAPLPKAPLIQTLWLPNKQRVSGALVGMDDKHVNFTTSWGKAVALERGHVVGISQDGLPIIRDGFETDLKAWRLEGNPALSQKQAFFGKSSLLLDQPGQSATREWPALRDGAVRLYFQHAAEPGLRWTFTIAGETGPAVVVDSAGYASANIQKAFGTLPAAAGWHWLSFEVADGRLRIYVDDRCLGETKVGEIKGLRMACTGMGKGELWIDELLVTRRLPKLPRPQLGEQDLAWLEHGEELFGRIVAADAAGAVLDAKFGKRTLPWSQLRGIFFASPKEPASTEPEVTFRPGPGFSLDCLRVKLVRWDDETLVVDHDRLGPIRIERERLDTIRFAAK
jgi:hypothetical protein